MHDATNHEVMATIVDYIDRLRWSLAESNSNIKQEIIENINRTNTYELIGIIAIATIGITIIIHQRKILKELRQLRELLNQKEDKPNGEEDISSN